jgi:hypothetical protein
MYNFWWSVGGFFASIALQSLNSRRPDDFRIAIYTQVGGLLGLQCCFVDPQIADARSVLDTQQWAQIGLMFCIYLFLPETPCEPARHCNPHRRQQIDASLLLQTGAPREDITKRARRSFVA